MTVPSPLMTIRKVPRPRRGRFLSGCRVAVPDETDVLVGEAGLLESGDR